MSNVAKLQLGFSPLTKKSSWQRCAMMGKGAAFALVVILVVM